MKKYRKEENCVQASDSKGKTRLKQRDSKIRKLQRTDHNASRTPLRGGGGKK